uniref:Uncharacterized protein n=1 Tax=Salix viminalis TaxID=40686 RepID=A0A6N2MED9_SALVM
MKTKHAVETEMAQGFDLRGRGSEKFRKEIRTNLRIPSDTCQRSGVTIKFDGHSCMIDDVKGGKVDSSSLLES